jgi:hypothetical protein
MSLKDEIQWASDHTLYYERSTFRHDEPVSAVIPVAALRARLEALDEECSSSIRVDVFTMGFSAGIRAVLAELEGL